MARGMDWKEFKQWLQDTEDGIAEEIKDCVEEKTVECKDKAKELCPVDTGYLKNSIDYRIEDGGTTGTVYVTAYYAKIQEYGDATHHAQPYLNPAFNLVKKSFVDELNEIVEEYLKKG